MKQMNMGFHPIAHLFHPLENPLPTCSTGIPRQSAREEDRDPALADWFQAYLTKPVEPANLGAIVKVAKSNP
jgi:CheY-like chemotaxis protein